MAYDPMPGGGSGPHGPLCMSCGVLITEEQRSVYVHFNQDPNGYQGLSGLYHEQCSRPFASMARILNMNWFGRF